MPPQCWRRLKNVLPAVVLLAMALEPADSVHGQRFGGRRGDRRGERPPGSASVEPAPRSGAEDRPTGASQSNYAALSNEQKAEGWASDQIRKHDKNGDKMLQPAEQAELGRSKAADANGDGTITKDELVAFSLGRSPAAPLQSSGSKPVGKSSDAATTPTDAKAAGASTVAGRTIVGATDKRKSYRFTPPAERLPAGLPSWFKSRDANGDGQVAMHEYGRSWSDRLAAEFVRYDTDNDGIITPAEAVRR